MELDTRHTLSKILDPPLIHTLPVGLPVLFLLSGPKMGFFAPQLRHIAPITLKRVKGDLTACPLPIAKFNVYRGRNVGMHPQNYQNFEFWP